MDIVVIQTISPPGLYTAEQIDRARRLAQLLDRGRLVLCERPAR